MKKNVSKVLCMLLAIAAIFCLHTAVFAAETEAPVADYQILGPMGSSDLDGNLVITTDGTELILEADFGAASIDTLAWDVISGKDVLAIHDRAGYPGEAIATPLANGEATVIAYLEDGSKVSATRKIIVSNQTPEEPATQFTFTCGVEGAGDVKRMTGEDSFVMLGTKYQNQHEAGTVMDLTAVEDGKSFKYWAVGTNKDIIVSTEKNFKFTLGQDITITAVFDKSDDGSMYGTNATFIYNNIVASNMYVK
ncbi:MAG: hypothetical protein IJD83_05580, partial [Clostridia bacterium]|nr:hypothetical protein [Clostridia bacterium]